MMEHDAKLETLIKMIAHAAHTSGLARLPLIVCAMGRMREAVRDPSIARRAEESISQLMTGAPLSARGLLRSMAWVARSAAIRTTALAETAIPALCADSVKLAELDWQNGTLTEISKAVAA